MAVRTEKCMTSTRESRRRKGARMRAARFSWRLLLPALVMLVLGCTSEPGTTIASPQGMAAPSVTSARQYTDPFAYCAAVGTVDAPGRPYVGPKMPDQIIAGFKVAAGLEGSTEPMDVLRHTTVWRCMGGRVYACNFGANLPCDSTADTSSEPTPAMTSYCQSSPDSAFIPMSVTGHATIYSWHCVGNQAATLEQLDHADAAGYLERIWYPIQPSP
jgi:hypothetical protein